MEVKKKEGESAPSLIYRFNKLVQHSGIIKEAKKRRFKDRDESKIKRRAAALYREKKKKEVTRLKKLGKM